MSNNLPTYLTISTDFNSVLEAAVNAINPDKLAVLVDENTRRHCLPGMKINTDLIIDIKSGEPEKTLATCEYIWLKLTEAGFTRKSLLINLGGGVIGDMGGFAAATFKRGMAFINVPTTLLSQVDASIGGKLGVDFNGFKNHIGMFQQPNNVIVNQGFLKTLPERELKSGFAEIIKHALIRDEQHWELLVNQSFARMEWDTIIPKSIAIKNEIVNEDPYEKGLRKILNYGHTIGHALETHFLSSASPLLHGEAIAWGMILENDIAVSIGKLDQTTADQVKDYLTNLYELPAEVPLYDELEKYLMQDKKNDKEGIRFSLLDKVGLCTYDVQIEVAVLREILR